MKKFCRSVNKLWKPYIVLPILTLLFLTGFIGSYLFPNTVLDTYVINMTEEEGDMQVMLPLSAESPVTYEMDTKGLAMRGIQVGVNKRGQEHTGVTLRYRVYAKDELVSDNQYDIGSGADLQYVYLPFANQQKCSGKLKITFVLSTNDGAEVCAPALMANHTKVEGTTTEADTVMVMPMEENEAAKDEKATKPEADELEDLSLKCSYIYTHDTYPFLYDCRLLTFVFLAAAMTVCFPKKKKEES